MRRASVPRRTIAASAAILLALLTGPAASSAAPIFSDGFESSDFSAWSQVQTGGDGMAAVQSVIVRTGSLAAQLSESSTSGSKAYLRKTFGSAQQDLTASGDFQVRQQGASGGNVPFFRVLDPSAARLVSVYRQNGTSGAIGVGYAGAHFATSGSLPLNTWATVALHVITAGSGSTVEVRLNGTLIYQTAAASLGTAGVSTVQLGNDTAAQPFNIVADTIQVDGGAPAASPPVNTQPPNISGTPQQGQTLTATTGNWSGTQPIAYAFQWRRCASGGANCADVAGATSASFQVTSADVGHTLRVVVTATNSAGSDTATSGATGVVQSLSAPPTNTAPPTISGTAREDQTLTASPGSWGGTQPITYGYQWRRCDSTGGGCGDIAGATSPTYLVVSADVGRTLRIVVTASNSQGSASATSSATAIVQSNSTQTGLVALWHMDETTGTLMRDSIAGHDGTIFSAQLGVPGFAGTAYGFGGSAYVSVPSAADLNPGSSAMTVTLHLKTTSVPATPDWDLIRKGLYTTAGGEFKMEYQPSGQASCGFKGSANYGELMAGPALNDGQWHAVQCVKTASAIKVVVDGQTFSKNVTIGSIANTSAVPIGARPGSEYFKGSLDEASLQIG
jgi:hypothetical protein